MVLVSTSANVNVYFAAFGSILQDLWSIIWWRWMPGTSVSVPWPASEPFDPDKAFRPWLEEHVGRQYWAWHWRFYGHIEGGRYGSREVYDEVEIRVRRDRAHLVSLMALKWR